MSVENPRWGAPRIHGELSSCGFEVAIKRGKTMVQTAETAKPRWPDIHCVITRGEETDISPPMDFSFSRNCIRFDLPLSPVQSVPLDRETLVWITSNNKNPTA